VIVLQIDVDDMLPELSESCAPIAARDNNAMNSATVKPAWAMMLRKVPRLISVLPWSGTVTFRGRIGLVNKSAMTAGRSGYGEARGLEGADYVPGP
jgi:hypothetical protein